jgi:AcrR family transcriptional regulator
MTAGLFYDQRNREVTDGLKLSERKRSLMESVTRDALYEAAVGLLREEGWKGFTMGKLAARAGVAKGTVYNYFDGKGDVLFFVMERNGMRTAEALKSLADRVEAGEADPVEALGEALQVATSGMYRNRHVIAAIVRAFEDDPRLLARKRSCQDPKHPLVTIRDSMLRILEAGVRSGGLVEVDPRGAEAVIHCTMMGLGRLLATEDRDSHGIGQEDISSLLTGIILHGLRRRRAEL